MANTSLEFPLKAWEGKAQFLPFDLLRIDWTGAKNFIMLHSPVWELWWQMVLPVLGQNSRLSLTRLWKSLCSLFVFICTNTAFSIYYK